jgi:tRNA threonylcarbamoyladenosine biosynthesis protein TsaB
LNLLLINSNKDNSFSAFIGGESENKSVTIVSYASDFPHPVNSPKKMLNPDKLIFCLNEVLNKCRDKNIDPENIDAVSVITGPGSFTGIRVGLSLAKGFADALKIKIIPIDNFELTLNQINSVHAEKEYCVLIPAKLPEYYYAIMNNFELKSEGCVELDKIDTVTSKNTILVCNFSNESVKNLDYFDCIDLSKAGKVLSEFDSMVSLSKQYSKTGKMYESGEVKPLYIKDFSIRLQRS